MTLQEATVQMIQWIRDPELSVEEIQERILGYMGGWDPATKAGTTQTGGPLRLIWCAVELMVRSYCWNTLGVLVGDHLCAEGSPEEVRYENLKAGVKKRICDYWSAFIDHQKLQQK